MVKCSERLKNLRDYFELKDIEQLAEFDEALNLATLKRDERAVSLIESLREHYNRKGKLTPKQWGLLQVLRNK